MSERYATQITIGGRISKRRLPQLLKAVRAAGVACHWGEPPLEPQSEAEILAAVHENELVLCDDQVRAGEFTELESACRKLGLSYSRWTEGFCEYDAEIVDWRPGMKEPRRRIGSNSGSATYVPEDQVRKALQYLESGQINKAKKLLRKLCPEVTELPPFEIT